jgi:hypothetical protein
MAKDQVHTYHCLCAELVIATYTPLQSMPQRKGDQAVICKVTESGLPTVEGVVLVGCELDDADPVVLKLDDGFEKRYAARCRRCDLQIGYWLDKNQFEPEQRGRRTDVVYLLPGGLMSTEDMRQGKAMEKEIARSSGVAV